MQDLKTSEASFKSPFLGIGSVLSAFALAMLPGATSLSYRFGVVLGQMLVAIVIAAPIFLTWRYATRRGRRMHLGSAFNVMCGFLLAAWITIYLVLPPIIRARIHELSVAESRPALNRSMVDPRPVTEIDNSDNDCQATGPCQCTFRVGMKVEPWDLSWGDAKELSKFLQCSCGGKAVSVQKLACMSLIERPGTIVGDTALSKATARSEPDQPNPLAKYGREAGTARGLTLKEFRSKYPMYNDLSDDEASERIFEKYYKPRGFSRQQIHEWLGFWPNGGY